MSSFIADQCNFFFCWSSIQCSLQCDLEKFNVHICWKLSHVIVHVHLCIMHNAFIVCHKRKHVILYFFIDIKWLFCEIQCFYMFTSFLKLNIIVFFNKLKVCSRSYKKQREILNANSFTNIPKLLFNYTIIKRKHFLFVNNKDFTKYYSNVNTCYEKNWSYDWYLNVVDTCTKLYFPLFFGAEILTGKYYTDWQTENGTTWFVFFNNL